MVPSKAACAFGNMFLLMTCIALQTLVFLLVVLGTPLNVFRARPEVYGVLYCYSMWGSKACGSDTLNPDKLPYKGFPSELIEHTMDTAATFATLSTFLTLIAMVLTVLLACRGRFRILPGIFSATSFCTLLVCWACIVDAYHKTTRFNIAGFVFNATIEDMTTYESGFALSVVAWCLQTVELLLLFCKSLLP